MTHNLILRPIEEDDLHAVMTILGAGIPGAWDMAQLVAYPDKRHYGVRLCKTLYWDDAIVGVLLFQLSATGHCYIDAIAVTPWARRLGFGSFMIQWLVDHAAVRRKYFYVEVDTRSAGGFPFFRDIRFRIVTTSGPEIGRFSEMSTSDPDRIGFGYKAPEHVKSVRTIVH